MGCSNWCNGSFWNFFTIIVYALEKMKDNAKPDIHFNDDTSKKISNLYKSCYNFDFVVALVITRSILSYTSAVTELLQKKSNDILQAYQSINRKCESSISWHWSQCWYLSRRMI